MATEMTSRETEPGTGAAWRLGSTLVVITGIAFLAVFTNSTGTYIGDFRFEVAWQPGQTLTRLPRLWDPTGGLGRVAGADRSPLPAALFAMVRAAGAPAWAAQRIWHGLLLTIAGTGCLAVVRLFAGRIRTWHVVSALAYMFSPVGLGLLLPSTIYATYAVAPWLLVAVVGGISGSRPWRWAAVFALSILLIAPAELPGTVYVTALALLGVPYVIHVERRSTWSRAVGWLSRAGLLTLLATSFVIVRTLTGSDALLTRLLLTESPETVASTTSWSETFRGLGHWLTYFRLGTADLRPNLNTYLENPAVVMVTFVIPLVALLAIYRSDWRRRLFFSALLVASLIVAVGLHPVDDPTPWGRLVGRIYRELPSTQALRNTMKIGAGAALAVAVLYGASVDWLQARLHHRRGAGVLVAAGAIGLLAVASLPVWLGELYPPGDNITEIPDYWQEAIEWLDEQPEPGRVLPLPGTNAAIYRWGGAGDDIFEALLQRPHIQSNVQVTSTPAALSVTFALDGRLRSAHLADPSLVPTLRRLGVRYVVLRNDLDWELSNRARPAALDPIRDDPGLRLARTFGEFGKNTTTSRPPPRVFGPTEEDIAATAYEETLPPVEVFELVDAAGPVRASGPAPDLLVSGDGESWFSLTALGLLAGDRPVRYVPDLDDGELVESMRDGATVVVTDTNVRRVLSPTRTSYDFSSALAPTDADDGTGVLFDDPGSQTVSWAPDAVSIDDLSGFRRDPWYRAEQAFDADDTSAWRIPPLSSPIGQGIEVVLRRPEPIGQISLLIVDSPARQLRGGHVELDDGTTLPFVVRGSRARVDFDGHRAQGFSVVIDDADVAGLARMGFADIDVEGLDLHAARQVPSEIFSRATADEDLAAALDSTPVVFAFEREVTTGEAETEPTLRRRFLSRGQRTFDITGRARVDGPADGSDCRPLFELDGVGVPVRIVGPSDALSGSSDFESCEPVRVGSGWHLLTETEGATIDRVELVEPDARDRPGASEEVAAAVVDRRPTDITVEVDASESGATVYSGIAYDPRWEARVDDGDHEVLALDGQVAVKLEEPGSHLVVFTYGPQRLYRLSVLSSMLTVVLCGALILGGTRRGVGSTELQPWAPI